MSDDEEECCNSGCNNCILDVRRRQKQREKVHANDDKVNLFDGTYRRFRVTKIERCNAFVRRIKLQFLNDDNLDLTKFKISLKPTQYLMLRTEAKEWDKESQATKHDQNTLENYISRPYTPIVWNRNELSFEILVKLELNGKMSEFISELAVNDVTEWKGAYGDFVWQAKLNEKRALVCICQGAAVAPLFALVSSILNDENDETRVHLIACFARFDDILLRTELAEARTYWNFRATIYLSRERCIECSEKRVTNCCCLRPRLKFNENVCNFRLDERELSGFYRNIKSDVIFTLFCGRNKLAEIIENSLNQMTDKRIKENYFRLE